MALVLVHQHIRSRGCFCQQIETSATACPRARQLQSMGDSHDMHAFMFYVQACKTLCTWNGLSRSRRIMTCPPSTPPRLSGLPSWGQSSAAHCNRDLNADKALLLVIRIHESNAAQVTCIKRDMFNYTVPSFHFCEQVPSAGIADPKNHKLV